MSAFEFPAEHLSESHIVSGVFSLEQESHMLQYTCALLTISIQCEWPGRGGVRIPTLE